MKALQVASATGAGREHEARGPVSHISSPGRSARLTLAAKPAWKKYPAFELQLHEQSFRLSDRKLPLKPPLLNPVTISGDTALELRDDGLWPVPPDVHVSVVHDAVFTTMPPEFWHQSW